jgi:hypothetical protein
MLVGALVLLIVVFDGSIVRAALRPAHRAKSKNDRSISARHIGATLAPTGRIGS